MKIGVIVAMDKELRQLTRLFDDSSRVRIEKCGIGKVNAALGAQRMITEFRPDAIISTGCAGGNGDDMNVQDVVVSTELCYHDVYCGHAAGNTVYGQVQGLPARFQADPELLQQARRVPAMLPPDVHVNIHAGLIVTGDWFVDSKEKMRDIIGHFPEARAVDMESAAIAQACHLNGVRFVSFRVVSDIPLRDSHASQYHDFWEHIADNSFQVTKTFIESILG